MTEAQKENLSHGESLLMVAILAILCFFGRYLWSWFGLPDYLLNDKFVFCLSFGFLLSFWFLKGMHICPSYEQTLLVLLFLIIVVLQGIRADLKEITPTPAKIEKNDKSSSSNKP